MSGFEIAGIVLGAFPLAIMALKQYREVADRVNLFHKIQDKHRKCMHGLLHQEMCLKHNLKQLILPLAVDYDKAVIEELLSNSGGAGWKDAAVSAKLEERLGDSYGLYLTYIQGMQETMKTLNRELAVDENAIQDQLQNPSATRSSRPGLREQAQFHLYRLKFSNGEAARQKLFDELDDYNTRLEKLRVISDEDTELTKKVAVARMKAVDLTICIFWEQATKVFQNIASAWTCLSLHQHHASLQLEHRTPQANDFTLLFEMSGQAPLPWEKRRTKISKGPYKAIVPSKPTKRVSSPSSRAVPMAAMALTQLGNSHRSMVSLVP